MEIASVAVNDVNALRSKGGRLFIMSFWLSCFLAFGDSCFRVIPEAAQFLRCDAIGVNFEGRLTV